MLETIKGYNSVKEIEETIDTEIAETKNALGEYLRKLDQIRTLAEKTKRVREIAAKLSGKKVGNNEDSREIEVGGLKIVLEANAFHEMTAMEDAVRSHQEHLLVLQKAREGLKPLDQLGDTEGVQLMTLESQGVPQRILLKTS